MLPSRLALLVAVVVAAASALSGCTAPPPRQRVITIVDPGEVIEEDCERDSQCSWDDDCRPAFCVPLARRRATSGRACEDERVAPGRCACVNNQCRMIQQPH